MRTPIVLAALLLGLPFVVADAPVFVPHVVVGVPDSGINPYHAMFYRPDLTAHPCSYIQGYPCTIPALELTLGGTDYHAAVEADASKWASIAPGDAFWIPRTLFVLVVCDATPTPADPCILDTAGHGTGTTSSIVWENPDALIAFKEGSSRIEPLQSTGVPIDIYSESWGNVAPAPGHPDVYCVNFQTAPLFVTAAGNDPRSTLVDCRKGEPSLITVGGAYASSRSEEALATKQPEVVSYYCRPTAVHDSATALRASYCGTSFAAPTVAGALSGVVLGLRESSGYSGGLWGGMVDPTLGVSANDLRDAMNRTASYEPDAEYANGGGLREVPLYGEAPWLQWGWGFYDGLVARATLAHLLGEEVAPPKSADAREHMALMHLAKSTLYDS